MYALTPSPLCAPLAGIAGHIGVGHAFSHSGFMQEDSVGFATLLQILHTAHAMDFTIANIEVTNNTVHVVTQDGGHGEATARHGFTPFERDMMQRAIAQKCLAPQTLATQIFGRMYGQGAAEPAAAFSLAIAKAYVQTVQKQWPEQCLHAPEEICGCCGEFLGGTLSLDGRPMAWLLSVNAALGGIGPVEDAEGTIPVGNKGILMQKLRMDTAPTLILESKAFVPYLADIVHENMFYARWNAEYDNPIVGQCLTRALEQSGVPFRVQEDAYPRNDMLSQETERIGHKIMQLGKTYAHTACSSVKVALAGDLARIVSHDLGASIFMSEAIFRYAGGGGLWPGQAAVLSLLATKPYAKSMGSMVITEQELLQMADIALMTVNFVADQHAEACSFVKARRPELSAQEILLMTSPAYYEQKIPTTA